MKLRSEYDFEWKLVSHDRVGEESIRLERGANQLQRERERATRSEVVGSWVVS